MNLNRMWMSVCTRILCAFVWVVAGCGEESSTGGAGSSGDTANEDVAEDDEDNTDQTITVLGAHPYTAKIDWGDGTIDRLMLIAEAETVPDMPPAELLGDCAAFLNKTEQ